MAFRHLGAFGDFSSDAQAEPQVMGAVSADFDDRYEAEYHRRMLGKLGLPTAASVHASELVKAARAVLQQASIGLHEFFSELAVGLSKHEEAAVASNTNFADTAQALAPRAWQRFEALYADAHRAQLSSTQGEQEAMALVRVRASVVPVDMGSGVVEHVCQAVEAGDDWTPFRSLIRDLRGGACEAF